jgi:RNA polymerase sigma factor (sigma-70 family)
MQHDLEREILELHRSHAPELLRFADAHSPCAEVCHDAVQEAFLRYFIERRYGREIENARAWLYQVVRNYLRDRMKRAASRNEVPLEDLECLPGDQRTLEDVVNRTETARQIASTLTGRELECLLLRSEGLSYHEIGRIMAVRTGTVGSTMTHVHIKLRAFAAKRRDWTLSAVGAALRHLANEAIPAPS